MSIRNSKALIGALFIQYCAYGVFYIMDEFKKMAPPLYKQINEDGGANHEENKASEGDEGVDNQAPAP